MIIAVIDRYDIIVTESLLLMCIFYPVSLSWYSEDVGPGRDSAVAGTAAAGTRLLTCTRAGAGAITAAAG